MGLHGTRDSPYTNLKELEKMGLKCGMPGMPGVPGMFGMFGMFGMPGNWV